MKDSHIVEIYMFYKWIYKLLRNHVFNAYIHGSWFDRLWSIPYLHYVCMYVA